MVKLGFVLVTLVVILLPYFPTARDYAALLLWLALAGLFWALAGIQPRRFYVLLKILLATFAFLVVVQGFMYRGAGRSWCSVTCPFRAVPTWGC